jgi:uncharacterized damage-inducible protein DinB
MELKEYILMELEGLKRSSARTLDSLKQPEIIWRPASGCNSIGLILFHIAKSEDGFVQGRLRGQPLLYESGQWYQKLNLPKDEAGAHYTADQVNAFPVPALADLLAYTDAVRALNQEYLKNLGAADLDKKFTLPHFGEITLAGIFSLVVSHSTQHLGEVSYLRGIQRGMDK